MKRTLGVFLIVALLTCVGIWAWKSMGEKGAVETDTRVVASVEVQEGAVSLDTPFEKKVLRKGDTLIESATQTADIPATPVQAEESFDTQSPFTTPDTEKQSETNLNVNIVDAWGDPVPEARLKIGDENYPASDGAVIVPQLTAGEYTLTANAPGFETKEKTVTLPDRTNVEITLEYLCSFDIRVTSFFPEIDSSVEGAEVTIWKGPQVQRPLPQTFAIQYDRPTSHRNTWVALHLQPEEEGLRIVRAVMPEDPGQEFGWNGDRIPPEQGDLIVGMTCSMWQQGDRSEIDGMEPRYEERDRTGFKDCSRLRIVDALRMRKWKGEHDFIEFERNGRRHFYLFFGNQEMERGEPFAQATTDGSGKCSFKDLPAGGYYIQARKGDARSQIKLMHPAQDKDVLILRDNGWLTVQVLKSGIEDRELASIEAASIRAKQINGEGNTILTGKTHSYGEWYTAIPWGQYEVRVKPPDDAGFGDAEQVKTIDIDDMETLVFEFTTENLYEISGVVADLNAKSPVSGFMLRLQREHDQSPGYWQEHDKMQSDSEGKFKFEKLVPGHYRLVDAPKDDSFNGYMSAARVVVENGQMPPFKNPEFKIEEESVADVEYLVVSAGKDVHVSGRAVLADGSPVSGAEVSLSDPDRYISTDGKCITGPEGEFELVIRLADDGREHTDELQGKLLEYVKRTQTTLPGLPEQVDEHPVPFIHAKGSLNITFRPGEDVENINLVLTSTPQGGSLRGKLVTEDGAWPIDPLPQLYAIQEGGWLPAVLDEDGIFIIDRIQPGTFRWVANSEFGYDGFREKQRYCSDHGDFIMPDPATEITTEILLKRAGELEGKLIDQQGNPVSGIHIYARSEKTSAFDISFTNGAFSLDGLDPRVPHSISVRIGNSREYTVLEGIVPPQENILIQIDPNSENGG